MYRHFTFSDPFSHSDGRMVQEGHEPRDPLYSKKRTQDLKVPAHFFKRNELEAILRFDLGFLAPLVYRLVPHPSCQWDGSLDGLQYHVFVYHQHELAIV